MSPWPSSPWNASTRPMQRPQTFYNALTQFGVISEPGLELSALRTAGVRTCNSGDRIPLEGATWRTPLPSIRSHPICYVTLRLEVMMAHQETFVQRDQHRIYVREYPGAEPAIVLMHGFPDNLHLYDRLSPYLSPPRRVVLFDFLGWGSSDKPSGYPYTTDNQVGDLDAVITQLGLGQVVLVVHDASGPPGIDWALAHPERVAGLVLLNTYYCDMPTLRPPEAIWLFSTPVVRSVARPVARMFGNLLFRQMYWWQVGRFIRDAEVRREFVPLLYQQFDATPSAQPAFFRLNVDLLPMVRSHNEMIPQLKEFRRPVRIIFGDADRSLNSGVARTFHEFLPGSELFLIPGAQHFVQLDEPEQVARLILEMPRTRENQV